MTLAAAPADVVSPAAAHPPRVVAAFDFDGTLTRRDTLLPFLARGLGWAGFAAVLLRTSPWLLAYALRLISNEAAKQKLFLNAFKGRSVTEVEIWTQSWLTQDLPGQMQPWTLDRLAWHQAQGHCCMMVSASPDIYLNAAAMQLGFDGLVCTEMQIINNHLTGCMRTPNCYGEQKVVRLKRWLGQRHGDAAGDLLLYAYGDTPGDWPMLRLADHAWYKNRPWAA